ncbi:MAG: Mpo1-like protein [Bacillota bacterium]
MGPKELLHWQWEGYPQYHQRRANLLLHIFTVPLFLVGSVTLLAAALRLDWALAALGAGGILVALVAQGRGHKLESLPPAPFTGPGNFVARLFLEQWITFPRFVLSGGWWRAYRGDAR